MTESGKFDNRTLECQLTFVPLHIGVDEEKDGNEEWCKLTIMPCTFGTPPALSAGDIKLPLRSEM